MRLPSSPRRAFTLIELIVVVVVLGLLAGIGVVAYGQVVTRSNDRKAALELASLGREAAALAATENRSAWALSDFTAALDDTAAGPVFAPGVGAAGRLSLVNAA